MNDAIVQSPRAAAHAVGEVPQDLDAVIGVRHLRVEQQRVELTVRRLHRRDRCRGARRRDLKSRRHRRHVVPMAGPDPKLAGTALKSFGAGVLGTAVADTHERMTELTLPDRRTSPPSMSVINCMP